MTECPLQLNKHTVLISAENKLEKEPRLGHEKAQFTQTRTRTRHERHKTLLGDFIRGHHLGHGPRKVECEVLVEGSRRELKRDAPVELYCP